MIILNTVIESTTFVLITLQLNPNFVPILTNFVIFSLYRYCTVRITGTSTKVWNRPYLSHNLVSAPNIVIFRKHLKNCNLCSTASLTF